MQQVLAQALRQMAGFAFLTGLQGHVHVTHFCEYLYLVKPKR